MDIAASDANYVSLYIDLKPNERVDLEVAALAAVQWARGIKAAAAAIDPNFKYRVSLVEAKPGSSKWLAKVERSRINQVVKDFKRGWDEVPIVMKAAISLVVVIPTTIAPTFDYWLGDDKFSAEQVQQIEDAFERANSDPGVEAHKREMYREAQKDPKISGLGGGIADEPDWRPAEIVPANRFAEIDGLFEIKQQDTDANRTIHKTIEVILVTPQLENAKRSWVFRQEGLPGKFGAIMADMEFLAALERNGIQERLRSNIRMTIKMEIKEEKVDGEWRVKPRGRKVVEVLHPSPTNAVADHTTK